MRKYIFILAAIIISSCKVNYSFRGGEIPGKTFSVESFTNMALIVNPNLAITLQDELQEKFTNESNLKYNDSRGDAHFQGSITNYNISPVQGTGSETVALNRLTITVKITYENSTDDQQNFDKSFTSYDDFESTEDFASKEDELVESITEKLVSLIYNQVLVDW